MLEVSRCAVCGQQFAWSADESDNPPTCCRQHRGLAPASPGGTAISRRPQTSAALANFPTLTQLLSGDDLQRLLVDASRPIEYRSRTLLEWFNNVDVVGEQLQTKFRAGDAAQALMEQRLEFVDTLMDAARRVEDFNRERLEAELDALKLEDEINEVLALRSIRLATKLAQEVKQYQRALEPDRPEQQPARQEASPAPKRVKPTKTERERVLDEVRRDRKARFSAADQMLEDFLREVEIVAGGRASIHERALQIRSLLEVFEQDEESLPGDARWILHVAERRRDAS
jgi:hypothetical protein